MKPTVMKTESLELAGNSNRLKTRAGEAGEAAGAPAMLQQHWRLIKQIT